ncbi:hypothetical protein B0H11DRAFT_1971789 [Mycena galericulata]|nr:hypothetical protein B0H11DRAFT_1971789 [Mycena galericulata]
MSTAAAVAELRVRREELKAIIAKDQALLVGHRKQMRKITRQLDVLAFPVLTLPSEIVCMIFQYCIARSPWPPAANWRCPAPLIFLHVCRTWRDIALGDPSLWTTLRLRFDEYLSEDKKTHYRTPKQIMNFAIGWVRRTRGLPLSLTLEGNMLSCLSKVQSVALIARLGPHVKQLQLEMEGELYVDWRSVQTNSIRWPILETVEIMSADGFPNITRTFSLAPRLRQLSDGAGDLSPSKSTPVAPWEQITYFYGAVESLRDCVEIFRRAENLEECSLAFGVGEDDEVDIGVPVLHHRLQKLSLSGFANYELEIILPLLTLPALRTLELPGLPGSGNSVPDFLARHSSELEDLTMYHVLVKSIPQLPALTRLSLCASSRFADPDPFTSDVFELLSNPETRFLPSLQHIHLNRFRSQEQTDYEVMARALDVRWRRHHSDGDADVAKLLSFTLWIKLADDELVEDFEEMTSPLVDLKAKGVDIRVKIGGSKW